MNLNFERITQSTRISSTINCIQQNTDMGITVELDETSQIYPALSELEGRAVVFLPCASWQKKEGIRAIKTLGAIPGMSIHLTEKTQVKEQIRIIVQRCQEMNMDTREVAVKISLVPDFKHPFSSKDVMQCIKEMKSCIPVTVILHVEDFPGKVAGASLLQGCLLELASWHNVEAALLSPEKRKLPILMLRGAETLSQKDVSKKNFMSLMRGKNANC